MLRPERYFKPLRVVILSKISRYQCVKEKYQTTEDNLKKLLASKGSDYHGLLHRHQIHINNLTEIKNFLKSRDVQYVCLTKDEFQPGVFDWADTFISAGGDGTFLRAASHLRCMDKPLLGINTDPERSEGYLCSKNPKETLNKLFSGRFRWSWRYRIKTTIYDSNMHCLQQSSHADNCNCDWKPKSLKDFAQCAKKSINGCQAVPALALNEVFFGESAPSSVSYYEVSIDGCVGAKQKSTGVIIYTGTGSTSWAYSTNKISADMVRQILKLANDSDGEIDQSLIEEVTRKYNDNVTFSHNKKQLAFAVREPIENGIFTSTFRQGLCNSLAIRSRGFDAQLVVDGVHTYDIPDGGICKFSLSEEDKLLTTAIED